MSGIRGKDTRPEIIVRQALHRAGFRFRLHRKDLPGKPDLALPKYHTIIFVHGCFWHGHGCRHFKIPKTRTDFWLDKIMTTARRDRQQEDALRAAGWTVFTVWECDIRDKTDWLSPIIIHLMKNDLPRHSLPPKKMTAR